MERQKIERPIENYIAEVMRSIREPIVERDAGKIQLDDKKAFFLLLPMLNGEDWTECMHTATIAVGAVHAAFEAHDAIDVSDATSRKQQLLVLSGDHYSGIHYRLLASLPDFRFIRSLSTTIGHINEMKTIVHNETPDNQDDLIHAIRIIEAGCVIDFLHTFGFTQYIPVAEAALPLFWLEGLKNNEADEQQGFNLCGLQDSIKENAIAKLSKQLKATIEQADFLQPQLRRFIYEFALQPIGKPI